MTIQTNDARITTTNATPQTVTLMPIPEASTANLTFQLNARSAAGDVFAAQMIRMAKRVGTGNAVLIGSPVVLSSQKDTGATAWAASLGVSGANLTVTVTGAAGVTIDWRIASSAFITI